MLPGFTKIVEARIRKAQQRGDFKNLAGTGKPLALDDDQGIPEELRMAYKILKNADCVPPEIELKKQIKRTEDLLAGMQDTAEKYRTLKKLNYLIMRFNSLRSASIEFDIPQRHAAKLVDRIGAKRATSKKNKHFGGQ